MVTTGSSPDHVTCVTVIYTLASLRRLDDATTLLKRMPAPSSIAWNAVISGYAQQSGSEHEVFGMYKDMMHGTAVRHALDANVFVGSSLINLYAKCGCVGEAMRMFDFSYEKNIVMWNAMLNRLVRNELQE
ncbi:hypothetical protein QYE76_008694 [Lolium multiflorum]|jgi:pentatricopeptide repeat protein|uniref:Pentatricopeptide repeat-containing protein n=1 Tax=Lolium multiflorum TaxID=4521 RepID=A0AAD8X2G3_LOLMU|nr:hypothetical protein QYE76_008694 [Lolium multiflorum]